VREVTFGRILPAWFFTLCENSCLGSWFKHAQWLFANATMALDESAHRLFVGCRSGAIVVFDSQS
jgi:hypothetical protein